MLSVVLLLLVACASHGAVMVTMDRERTIGKSEWLGANPVKRYFLSPICPLVPKKC